MKLLFISHFVPYPPKGGSLQRNYNLIREIAREHEIYLVTFTLRPLLPDEAALQEAVEQIRPFCRYVKVFKIPSDYNRLRWYGLLLANLLSPLPYSVWRFHSKGMHAEVRRLLDEIPFDLVYADTIDLAPYVSHSKGLPTALNHHNVESSLLLRRASNEKNLLTKLYVYLQGRKLRRFEKKHVPGFDLNIMVSQEDLEDLKGYAPARRFEVIPNGTDPAYFTPAGPSAGRELIYAGGLGWYPNRDAMIYFCESIFPLVRREEPASVMNVIGSFPPSGLIRLAATNPAIKVHGFVDDVRPWLARSSVYVVPIRVGGGTRLKILDAFAAGKAVVSTTVGCEGIDVTPEEDLLIADSPEEFAAQVVRLLRDDSLRHRLELNARQLVVRKYAWSAIGAKLNSVYGEMTRGRSAEKQGRTPFGAKS